MVEEWRDIAGYEGIYQISNLGRVKSLGRTYWHGNRIYRQKEKLLKLGCDSSGYNSVMLYNHEHQSKRIMVHLLVARTFIPNPENLPEVNHKDENKHNNIISNLEWCTRKYNVNYGTVRERWRESMIKSNGWKKSDELKLRVSNSMKAHIQKRKIEGTYWFGNNNTLS